MKHDNENCRSDNELDSALDAALAKYAAAEPRKGLEERILANLRSLETRAADRIWRNWRIAIALAALLVIALALASRWTTNLRRPLAKQPSSPTAPVPAKPAHRKTGPDVAGLKGTLRKSRRPMQHQTVAANPKLDVFPSPLPLSEQEKILATYVAQYPDHAALVAEARMDAIKQEADARRDTSEREQNQ